MGIPNPIAFTLLGREVRWYGILIACALLLGLLLATKRSRQNELTEDDVFDFFIALVPAIVIGARAYYVIFEWSYYSQHTNEILKIWNGGLAIHGGIIAGILTAYIFCRIKKINFWNLTNTLIPSLPLGQAIGRWGNYFNMEAHGKETTVPWAITVIDPIKGLIQVHPTFLYESIWDLLVFGFLLIFEKKWQHEKGELLFVYAILYSIGRFFIEGLRTDSLMFFNIRIAQMISVVLIIIGIFGIYWLRKKNSTNLTKK